ncbi:MAG: thiamine pyrophosphate-dependent enzyme [Candidatus Bathyarchaeia archaeon]
MSTFSLKKLAKQPELLTSGHRLCAGCGAGIVGRLVMSSLRKPGNTIVVQPTGCFEVATTIYPETAWKVPWLHSAFENAASTASGIVAAYRSFKRRKDTVEEPDVICISGDGGTLDIGFQALSGAWERGDRFVYVLYDNQGYMNTGTQRSSATPYSAWTTTTPVGKILPGNVIWRKPIARIAVEHDIPYVATANPAYWRDHMEKLRKALEAEGPAFIHSLAPCPLGWRFPSDSTIQIARLATETCVFPLWECVDGGYKLSHPSRARERDSRRKKPVVKFLELQGRFRHLFKPRRRNDIIKLIQRHVDNEWDLILSRCGLA